MHAYAGIGSRDITPTERNQITRIANYLVAKGYFLYSGGADGADKAFEESCRGYGLKFLPWPGFNMVQYSKIYSTVIHSDESMESVMKYHPAPHVLSEAARKLMSRNYYQIHGFGDLPKVDFVVCCADPIRNSNGEVKGGTGQAVRIALDLNIPVFNIRDKNSKWEAFMNWLPTVKYSSREEIENSVRSTCTENIAH